MQADKFLKNETIPRYVTANFVQKQFKEKKIETAVFKTLFQLTNL